MERGDAEEFAGRQWKPLQGRAQTDLLEGPHWINVENRGKRARAADGKVGSQALGDSCRQPKLRQWHWK